MFRLITIITLLWTPKTVASNLESYIRQVATKEGVSPDLAVAIAKVESSFDTTKVGELGEIGLYQLRPEFHKFNERDIAEQIRVAIKYLAYVKTRCYKKYQDAWFICFNTGPYRKHRIKRPKEFDYYKKVMGVINDSI